MAWSKLAQLLEAKQIGQANRPATSICGIKPILSAPASYTYPGHAAHLETASLLCELALCEHCVIGGWNRGQEVRLLHTMITHKTTRGVSAPPQSMTRGTRARAHSAAIHRYAMQRCIHASACQIRSAFMSSYQSYQVSNAFIPIIPDQ